MDNRMSTTLSPTVRQDRLPELDLLRGFAVLGIFIMNVIGFALPYESYGNPAIAGGDQGLDLLAFYVQDAIVSGKMRGIFCLLFGAGLALSLSRADRHGFDGAALLHRRYLWLLVIAIAHVMLLQMPGDILFEYSIVALLIWSIARASTRKLLSTALVLLGLVTAINLISNLSDQGEYQRMTAMQAELDGGATLDKDDLASLEAWQEEQAEDSVEGQRQAAEKSVEGIRGATSWAGTWQILSEDLWYAVTLNSDSYYLLAIAGTMLLGVVLFRVGFLTGGWSTKRYLVVLLLAILAALATHALTRAWANTGFSNQAYTLDSLWILTFEPFRILISMGWIAGLILLLRALGDIAPLRWLMRTGRMALTIYLSETLIATTLFWGWGLGLYGEFSRFEVLCIAAVILASLVLFANLWLLRFKQGPMEWLWRRLSYGPTGPGRNQAIAGSG
ncbi:MAG: DUF418 domain-containing protein [Pseudomonadota bacterium]